MSSIPRPNWAEGLFEALGDPLDDLPPLDELAAAAADSDTTFERMIAGIVASPLSPRGVGLAAEQGPPAGTDAGRPAALQDVDGAAEPAPPAGADAGRPAAPQDVDATAPLPPADDTDGAGDDAARPTADQVAGATASPPLAGRPQEGTGIGLAATYVHAGADIVPASPTGRYGTDQEDGAPESPTVPGTGVRLAATRRPAKIAATERRVAAQDLASAKAVQVGCATAKRALRDHGATIESYSLVVKALEHAVGAEFKPDHTNDSVRKVICTGINYLVANEVVLLVRASSIGYLSGVSKDKQALKNFIDALLFKLDDRFFIVSIGTHPQSAIPLSDPNVLLLVRKHPSDQDRKAIAAYTRYLNRHTQSDAPIELDRHMPGLSAVYYNGDRGTMDADPLRTMDALLLEQRKEIVRLRENVHKANLLAQVNVNGLLNGSPPTTMADRWWDDQGQ